MVFTYKPSAIETLRHKYQIKTSHTSELSLTQLAKTAVDGTREKTFLPNLQNATLHPKQLSSLMQLHQKVPLDLLSH